MTAFTDDDIDQVRAFNRAYTARLGLLDAYLADSNFTLSEGRILYELAHRQEPTAAEIGRALNLDRAQISRTLKRFAERGLVISREDPANGRHQLLALTPVGRSTFEKLDQAARSGVSRLLSEFPLSRRKQLVRAAASMREIFSSAAEPSLILRAPKPGDLGIIIHRQAVLYNSEYGYDSSYEALIAQILAEFHRSFDPDREAAWIAELDGRMVGSIFLVQASEPETGKLRLLYVEPDARGAGVGGALVRACVERARAIGYQRLELWTDSQLTSARRLYRRAGFVLRETKNEWHFGRNIGSETWAMTL